MTTNTNSVFRKAFFLALGLFMAMYLTLALPAISFASDRLNVSDSAGVLTSKELKSLESTTEELAQEYDMNVLVMYVDQMSKSKVRDSAIEEYKRIEKFDGTDEATGVMLYIAVNDRQMITLTRGTAIAMFTDSRIDETEEAVASDLSDDDWYQAGITYLEMTDESLAYFDKNKEPMPATDGRNVDFDYDDGEGNWMVIVGAGLIVGVGIAICTRKFLKGQLKSVEAGHDANNYQTHAVNVTASSERFMGTTVTRVPLPETDSGSGGGGTSSSGGFGGGGGRSF